MKFIPNLQEQTFISEITKIHPEEYAVIRVTSTMLKKSIIDASSPVRSILKNNNIIDYDFLQPGSKGKIMQEVLVLTNDVTIHPISFYRPKTKEGDPRLWIYGLKNFIRINDMIFFTIVNGRLVIIPLTTRLFSTKLVQHFFGDKEKQTVKKELINLLSILNSRGPVRSVSPFKLHPKDIGDTLERELDINPNSNKLADFKSSIELKAKLKGSQTKDTLFSMVPNWTLGPIPSSNQMIQTYGYPSKKYNEFIDLFVTVSNTPNNQGLFLEVDEEKNILIQFYKGNDGRIIETAVWKLDEIKQRLQQKHPETVWVVGEKLTINGELYFHYKKAVYTRSPIFSSFISLISQGLITYDWRGRVKKDGSFYKDKGHCFRVSPKYRHLLFNVLEDVEL